MTTETVNYAGMEGHKMLEALGDNGQKWAAAFCQTAKRLGYGDLDEEWVFTWFANAIEHSHDVRTGSGPVILDDGSAFFVAEV